MAKQQKQTKVISKRKKFVDVDVPLTKTKVALVANSINDVQGKTIKLDLTRQLRGKSIEAVLKVKVENDQATAHIIKIKLMPYFIRRMIRKRISYVEDSFDAPSQESLIKIKPFIITRKKVSRVVRKTIRNQTKNWMEDYLAERKDEEIFNDILANKLQKQLSMRLKKTYPLSLCEIRILEIKRALEANEIPKKKEKPKIETKKVDQLTEIEDEIKTQEVKEAEKEIKETQAKAVKKEIKKTPKKDAEKEKPNRMETKVSLTSHPSLKRLKKIKVGKKK